MATLRSVPVTPAQAVAPLELYHKPQNTFVAGFIGNPRMNFLPVRCVGVSDQGVQADLDGQMLTIPVTVPPSHRPALQGTTLTLGIRPEHIAAGRGEVIMTVTPTVVEYLGQNTIGYAPLPDRDDNFCFVLTGTQVMPEDTTINLSFATTDCHLFDAEGMAFERQINLAQMTIPQVDPEMVP